MLPVVEQRLQCEVDREYENAGGAGIDEFYGGVNLNHLEANPENSPAK